MYECRKGQIPSIPVKQNFTLAGCLSVQIWSDAAALAFVDTLKHTPTNTNTRAILFFCAHKNMPLNTDKSSCIASVQAGLAKSSRVSFHNPQKMLQDPSPILIEVEEKRGQNILTVSPDFIGRKRERQQNINMCTFRRARFKKKNICYHYWFSQKGKNL